jgi:hypothetical protein
MQQRQLSTALVPVGDNLAVAPRTLTAFFQIGSRTAIQTSTGSAAAIFALEGYDRRLQVAAYSLQIMNNSSATLLCRVWAVSRIGEAELAYPLAIEVAPFSVKSTNVPVRMDAFDSFERAIAEISGDGVHCTVEAAAPVPRRRRGVHPAFAAAGFALALIAGGGYAIGDSIPRIGAFAAPPSAVNGTTVQAQYNASGVGSLAYDITGPDGNRVAGGPLTAQSGTIYVALPPSRDAGVYAVHLHMSGPFGADDEQRIVRATPARLAGATIASLSVSPIVAKAGQPVNVFYRASGSSGEVRLVDANGNVWARQPFSRSGETILGVPPFLQDRELQVVVRVLQGSSVAQSSAGLLVSAAHAPAATPEATAPKAAAANTADTGRASSAADTAADGYANGTFQVEAATVKSGGTIHVRILSPRNGMRLALTDTQSREITSVNVGVDQDSVALRAPNVQVGARYIVVASFTDGFGQESIVQPVTVTP